ncbi:sigma-70 family RNA polymerase sigma factor [Sutcliffiella deserti]|uniref:sigma-70 family RNA polymerase sigma factor n=1 Tax=Sutcliffiella deserti TaxID=2875501 RepID=UPI001CBDD296|nr:sigma-70 family RNA polymerase sigma factor [Sutcliffiella deserti]
MDEIILIRKAIQGDPEAFEHLLAKHSDRLYRTAYLYVRNREDALDVIQETAFKAFSSISQLRNEEFFLTWLTKILIHCAYDVQKKRKNVVVLEEQVALQREKHEERMDLTEAIGKLPEKHQTSIILFYYYDMSLKDIAQALETPENTIKTYINRGKKQLRKLLGGSYFDGQRHIHEQN